MIRTALKFGAFVLVCLLFTGYLAFTIGNLDVRDPLNRQTYRVRATFEDVTGLLQTQQDAVGSHAFPDHPDQPFEKQSRGCARSRIEPVIRIDNRADFTAAGGLRQHRGRQPRRDRDHQRDCGGCPQGVAPDRSRP